MKTLTATVALICLSSTVPAHDIYTDLRDRDGHLCCNGQDCRPVQATVLPNGNYYLPSTGEIIPAEEIGDEAMIVAETSASIRSMPPRFRRDAKGNGRMMPLSV